jgi:hypothetical protein
MRDKPRSILVKGFHAVDHLEVFEFHGARLLAFRPV